MPQRLLPDVLTSWRDGERLLRKLPPLSPDHESLAMAVNDLRVTYAGLVKQETISDEMFAASQSTIRHAQQVIAETQGRVNRRPAQKF